ncbi:MAG: alpha-L-fucosidase [Clostridia bacterium]|nr:alpha-L-fucosidase [Clostridia bacterium]
MSKGQDRLSKSKIGVFNHYLGRRSENWEKDLLNFDVKKLAMNLKEMGVRYYFITVMQGERFMLSPSEVYNKITGYTTKEVSSERDLIKEIGEELKKYDIDLYLYYTGDGPHNDEKGGTEMGYYDYDYPGPWVWREELQDYSLSDNILQISEEFVSNWASVLEEYAIRYGNLIKGWWIDGCYDYFGYNQHYLDIYRAAVKKGNPDAIVTFNNGVKNALTEWGNPDYTAGERNDLKRIPESRFIGSAQAHILVPVGTKENSDHAKKGESDWCSKGLFFNKEELLDYAKKVTDAGGAVTFDIFIDTDASFDKEQIEAIKYVTANL